MHKLSIQGLSRALSPLLSWRRLAGEARTRILAIYALLLLSVVAVGFPLMYRYVFRLVDQRVREDLLEEVEGFQGLLAGELSAVDQREWMQVQRELKRSVSLPPQTVEEAKVILDFYLTRRIPQDDTFLIAIAEGQFYNSSPRALPELFAPGNRLMQRWQELQTRSQGEPAIQDPTLGSILYVVEPITVGDRVLGSLVAVHGTRGEQQEAVEAIFGAFQVISGLVVVLLIAAWWLSGEVLKPLRTLAATAHRISETDLSIRIPVQGQGEIAQLATTFNEMMERLDVAFETQRNFIRDASHELQTPITIVQGHLELMGDDPEERAETLELAMDELDRMSRLVRDLLLLVRSDRPDFLVLESIDTAAFMPELFTKVRVLAERDWVLVAPAEPIQWIGDRHRLTEAVLNLAQNAVQHTQSGATITLGCTVELPNHLLLWVQDTGEGIELEDQALVFERFARAKQKKRRSNGLGLGLAIVSTIVEAHHGTVRLSSQPGQGSTFTLVLPMVVPNPAPVPALAP